MRKFIEIPANPLSLKTRKPLYGIGINDADYLVQPYKHETCPYYQSWADMIRRCYDPKYQQKRQKYIGCVVCSEWLLFSNFKQWLKDQGWDGGWIDKDAVLPGNKLYHPDLCRFKRQCANNPCSLFARAMEQPAGEYRNQLFHKLDSLV